MDVSHLQQVLQRIEAIQARLGESATPESAQTFQSLLATQTAATRAAATPDSTAFDPLIERIAGEQSLSPALLRAVIKAESNFHPEVVSPKGAMGLMQLMPATAASLGVSNPFDPAQNIDGGARYLRQLLDQFGGDQRQALAAYNAGPGAVLRYHGVPPFPETRQYVERVLRQLGEQ